MPETQPNTAAEVAALRATIEAFMENQKASQAEAKEIRAKILSDIGVIHDEASAIQHRVSNLEAQMVEANKVVSSVNDWKAKASGAMIVLGLVGTITGTVLWFLWQTFKDKILSNFTVP